MLRGQKNLLVAGQRFFQRAHGSFASHDERVIMCGKITMSRTGIMGTRFTSSFSFKH